MLYTENCKSALPNELELEGTHSQLIHSLPPRKHMRVQVAVHELEVAMTFVTDRDSVGGMLDGDLTNEMAATNMLASLPGNEGEVQEALEAIANGERAVASAMHDAITAAS